jgi:Signal transduction histidine kinase
VARAVCDVAARHRASAASKDVDLTVKTPIPPLPMMLVDRLRFEQIVENLVSNAVKFTPSGHVRIAVAASAIDAGHVEMTLTVTDTGPGVPLAAREVIFEEFYRLEPTEREGPVGTGLGLPIARGLARAMGGDISVGSGTDGGAVFRVSLRLPVANDAACAECDRPLAGLSIVLAEDDPIILEITAHRLREAGAEVIEAADGAAAVAAVLGSRPDAAVLDLEMPILGGVCAVLRLPAHPALGGLLRVRSHLHASPVLGHLTPARPVWTMFWPTGCRLSLSLRLCWEWGTSRGPWQSGSRRLRETRPSESPI